MILHNGEKFLTFKEAASKYGCSKKNIYNKAEQGYFKTLLIHGVKYLKDSDVPRKL